MTTKDQERKALEQIRKIVESLGENSYIGTAFEGCFEMAEDNIKYDTAFSMKTERDNAEFAEEQLRAKVKDQEEEIKALRESAEESEEIANRKIENATKWCAKYHEAAEMATENWNKFREQEERAEALEAEIIKLKAKLYDLMTA